MMSVWNPVPITVPGGWGTVHNDTWHNWKTKIPKALVCKLIIMERLVATFLEKDGPHKY